MMYRIHICVCVYIYVREDSVLVKRDLVRGIYSATQLQLSSIDFLSDSDREVPF